MPRPASLDPLFRSLTSLKGVGPQLGALMTRFFGPGEGHQAVALDVLMHMPSSVIDRRRMVGIGQAFLGDSVTDDVQLVRHAYTARRAADVPPRAPNRSHKERRRVWF